MLERLEGFLAGHTCGDDLGLRLRGEQLAAGVRFVRMIREGTYDLVVATRRTRGRKMADASIHREDYPLGKADLYAAFLLRGLELVREGGVSAMLTMRNWMFIKQYADLRDHLLSNTFELLVARRLRPWRFRKRAGRSRECHGGGVRAGRIYRDINGALSNAQRGHVAGRRARTRRKRAAALSHEGRFLLRSGCAQNRAGVAIDLLVGQGQSWIAIAISRSQRVSLRIFPGVVTGNL